MFDDRELQESTDGRFRGSKVDGWTETWRSVYRCWNSRLYHCTGGRSNSTSGSQTEEHQAAPTVRSRIKNLDGAYNVQEAQLLLGKANRLWVSEGQQNDFRVVWKDLGCHILLVLNRKPGPISHRFWDTVSFRLKNAHFPYPVTKL